MAQPYDYSGAFSRTDPLQIAGQLGGLTRQGQTIEANKLAMQQAQQQQAQQQQLQGLLANTPFDAYTDPQQFQQMIQQNPALLTGLLEQQQVALGQEQLGREQQAVMDADSKKQINRAASSLLTASETGNPDVIMASIDNHSDLISSTGDEAITPDVLKDIVMEDPQKFREFMQGVVSRTGGMPVESRKLDIEEKKFNTERADKKLQIRQTSLENRVKNAKDLVSLEKAEEELNQLNEKRDRYGSLADNVSIATDKFDAALSNATAVEQLDRSLNMAFDLNDLDGNFKTTKAANLFTNWFKGSTDMDDATVADHVKAIQAGNLDIARQLAETLKPVSGEQLKLVLDGLEGGDLRGTIEALRGTRINTASKVAQDRKFLEDNGAGLASSIPDVSEFQRQPFGIQRERIDFGSRPPQTPQPPPMLQPPQDQPGERPPPGTPIYEDGTGARYYFINGRKIPVADQQQASMAMSGYGNRVPLSELRPSR